MKIKYQFATKETVYVDVEVTEEVEAFLRISRRAEHASNERQRYHRAFSLDAVVDQQKNLLENRHYAYETNMIDEDVAEREQLWALYNTLSDVQKRRVRQLYAGISLREIAKVECVNYNAVYTSVVGIRKVFHQFEHFHFDSLVYKEGAF